jgi:6-pyruvoyltetrahydropterin/6-carboxytetrahydropterin synthase
MYTLTLQRDLIGLHFLVGGDFGAENELHAHHYRVEISLEGARLNRLGYLVDLDELDRELQALLGRFRNQTLNELPEFEGLNPSIEHFARILCLGLQERIETSTLSSLSATVWEDGFARASYRVALEA